MGSIPGDEDPPSLDSCLLCDSEGTFMLVTGAGGAVLWARSGV